MSLFKGIYFWLLIIGVTIAMLLVVYSVKLACVLLRREDAERRIHICATFWGKAVFQLTPGWRVTVQGEENLPADRQPVVMAVNHESMTDIWALYFTSIQFRWLSKKEVFQVPLLGRAMRWAGYVSVERGKYDSHVAALEESAARLRAGVSMAFFPEGTRSFEPGNFRPFKSGAFRLAQNLKLPILPVVLRGTGNLLPKGKWVPGRATVRIKILPEITATTSEDSDLFASRVRELMLREYRSL